MRVPRRLGEFELIARLAARTTLVRRDVALGIGDDAALLRAPRGQQLAATVDTLNEGVHFPAATAPAALGWKALAVNLSDLAAMGARPAWFTLALSLPRTERVWVDAFARGLARLARQHRVALIGGDTTRGPLSITIGATGFVPARRALTRAGARPGDLIVVSGTLGDAAAGLAVVQRRLTLAHAAAKRRLIARLELPTPRIELGLALRGLASAAIDLSDGLVQDLGHVLNASGVGARLDPGRFPASRTLMRAVPSRTARLALQSAGDDYELCFTLPQRGAQRLTSIARRLGLPLTIIGSIRARRGIEFVGPLATAAERAQGFTHFSAGPA